VCLFVFLIFRTGQTVRYDAELPINSIQNLFAVVVSVKHHQRVCDSCWRGRRRTKKSRRRRILKQKIDLSRPVERSEEGWERLNRVGTRVGGRRDREKKILSCWSQFEFEFQCESRTLFLWFRFFLSFVNWKSAQV
jgi:hypothetical protein